MPLPDEPWYHKPRLMSALQAVSIWMQHHILVIKYPCLRIFCISFISQSLFHTVGMFNATVSLIVFIPFVPLNLLLLTTQIFLKINSLKSFPLALLDPQMRFEHFVKSKVSQCSHGGFTSICSAASRMKLRTLKLLQALIAVWMDWARPRQSVSHSSPLINNWSWVTR